MRKNRILIAPVFMMFIFILIAGIAYAGEQKGSLTLHTSLTMNNEEVILENDEYSLMLVAEEVYDEAEDCWIYVTISTFAEWECDWSLLDDSQSTQLAQEVEAYIAEEDITYNQVKITDMNGNVQFNDLQEGLYLVSRTNIDASNEAYYSEPFFVQMPLRVGEEVLYDYTVKVKFKEVSEDDTAEDGTSEGEDPTTGDKSNRMMWFWAMSLSFMFCVLVYRRQKKG